LREIEAHVVLSVPLAHGFSGAEVLRVTNRGVEDGDFAGALPEDGLAIGFMVIT
jgi:hypothetical protein